MTALTHPAAALTSWWCAPLPRARIAWMRHIAYAFIFVDVLLTTSWVALHRNVPTELYRPLAIARFLHLPAPTHDIVVAVEVVLLIAAAVAVTGRLPRLAGWSVFVAYLTWMFIAMSYGKVDHDRVAFLVALAVLPTAGPARISDPDEDDAAGWALRMVQVAVMLTYFLAAFAKLRYGGLGWVNSATLTRAVIRRGTDLGRPLAEYPDLLRAVQWGLVGFELTSPLLLVRGWLGRVYLAGAAFLHLVTFLTITIIFLPHVVALLSYLPLERLWRRRATTASPADTSGTAAARQTSSPGPPRPSRSG